MGWIGLALLALALLLMLVTGWATYAVLLGVCTLGALLGLALGSFDAALLGSLPGRVIGLLEHDLLQALALYALVGALLQRLSLADALYSGLRRGFARVVPGAAAELAGLGLGALLAPMNGSVGASLLTLARSTRAQAGALPHETQAANVALASTLGVIVPPSLVLLLLGDAMMRAHTEGLNIARSLALPLAQADIRIVNTQDVLQATLLPGLLVLLGWLAITAWRGRGGPGERGAQGAPVQRTPWPAQERWVLLLVPALIVGMLAGVASGQLRAVEAAAGAALLLLAFGALSGQLRWPLLRGALDDAMALTGALFALLLAATSFSLLLRAFGTDRLVSDAMMALQGHPLGAVALVLVVLLASAFVLDAFELIFLVVPVVMPPLLAQVADAAWVAALALLVLQAGFLLPPLGYAVVLARGQWSPRPALAGMARVLLPCLAWAAAVVALVLVFPQCTHWWRSTAAQAAAPVVAPGDVDELMRQMSAPRGP
jgi:TRAP-type mannitol/chloroaromatic compound transport system permease large subunit